MSRTIRSRLVISPRVRDIRSLTPRLRIIARRPERPGQRARGKGAGSVVVARHPVHHQPDPHRQHPQPDRRRHRRRTGRHQGRVQHLSSPVWFPSLRSSYTLTIRWLRGMSTQNLENYLETFFFGFLRFSRRVRIKFCLASASSCSICGQSAGSPPPFHESFSKALAYRRIAVRTGWGRSEKA
jgi:hypothetical protein